MLTWCSAKTIQLFWNKQIIIDYPWEIIREKRHLLETIWSVSILWGQIKLFVIIGKCFWGKLKLFKFILENSKYKNIIIKRQLL